jgi:hypothetical protein
MRTARKAPRSQQEFALRLTEAMRLFGVTRSEVEAAAARESLVGIGSDPTVDRIASDKRVAIPSAWAVAAAERIGVDPRWLIAGRSSPAALAALDHFACAFLEGQFPWATDPRFQFLLKTIPQPALHPFTCRYCACWLDACDTICSSCLDPEAT